MNNERGLFYWKTAADSYLFNHIYEEKILLSKMLTLMHKVGIVESIFIMFDFAKYLDNLILCHFSDGDYISR